MRSYLELVGKTDEELAATDPLVMNLLVARSIPGLENLEIPRYQAQRDAIAAAVNAELPNARRLFLKNPSYWKNDLNFINLAALCETVARQTGIAYKEDHRELTEVCYTDPSDLFLNGVMDTRRGTCGNMAALLVAVAWKLGWPLRLACRNDHCFARYDDGKVTYNVEASAIGLHSHSNFKSDPDDFVIQEHKLPPIAVACGSELRALTPRETLGLFVGNRGRHMKDIGNFAEAQKDYLLARYLFPSSRRLYLNCTWLSIEESVKMFEGCEKGTPQSLVEAINSHFGFRTLPIRFEYGTKPIDVGFNRG